MSNEQQAQWNQEANEQARAQSECDEAESNDHPYSETCQCAPCYLERQSRLRASDSLPRVVTEYLRPPVPTTAFDWIAYREGQEEWHRGFGKTEAEAIAKLIESEN